MRTSYLCDDLIAEILLRLPAKSIARFRCVCKSWFFLISSPELINKYLNHSHNNNLSLPMFECSSKTNQTLYLVHFPSDHRALVGDRNFTMLDTEVSSLPSRNCMMIGSYNGVTCLFCAKKSVTLRNPSLKKSVNITLWNPSLKKSVEIPIPHVDFDVFRYCKYFGFGHDSTTDDYKVVMLPVVERRITHVHIYSLKLHRWTKISNVDPLPNVDVVRVSDWPPSLINGRVVHWVVTCEDDQMVSNFRLLSFDISEEVFGEIELPESLLGDTRISNVESLPCATSKGLLSLFAYSWDGPISVWVMKEYGLADSWIKLLTIDCDFGQYRGLGIFDDSTVVLFCTGEDKEVILLDAKSREKKYLGVDTGTLVFSFGIYMESLVLINHGNSIKVS